ncbi:MAG: hypothetical protein R3Y50_07995 [Rikenellaceae bacterium]
MEGVTRSRAGSPRQRRADLLSLLKRGDQRRIAQRANCSASTVSAVLNGRSAQNTATAKNIVRVTEYIIETNKLRK